MSGASRDRSVGGSETAAPCARRPARPLVSGVLKTSDYLMENDLQFDRVQQPAASACSACQSALLGSYFQANGQILCDSCAENIRKLLGPADGGFARFLKAAAFGIGGGLAGGAVYFGVLKFAHINASIITILIGWLVGKAVRKGSDGRGGLGFQILAVAITYLTIGLTFMIVSFADGDGHDVSPVGTVIACIVGAFIAPVLAATESILGAIITFFGLMQAWQMNRRINLEITGPHALAPVAQIPPPILPGA